MCYFPFIFNSTIRRHKLFLKRKKIVSNIFNCDPPCQMTKPKQKMQMVDHNNNNVISNDPRSINLDYSYPNVAKKTITDHSPSITDYSKYLIGKDCFWLYLFSSFRSNL